MQREALTSDLMKRVSLGNSRTYLYVWCTLKPYNLGDVSAVLDNGDCTGNDVHETEECAHDVGDETSSNTGAAAVGRGDGSSRREGPEK